MSARRQKMRKALFVIGLIVLIVGVLFTTVPLIPVRVSYKVQVKRTRQVPYEEKITKTAKWQVSWRTITGELKWGAEVGTSVFPAIFDYDWKGKEIYGDYKSYIGFYATMQVYVNRSGPISFKIGSDDGSRLYIDDELVIDNWGSHSYTVKSTVITLPTGKHYLEMWYYNLPGIIGDSSRVSFECDRDILTWQETVIKYRNETYYETVIKYRTEMRSLFPQDFLPYIAIIGSSIILVAIIPKQKAESPTNERTTRQESEDT